jgi:serine/threonine protein phosphatase 1
MLIEETTLKKYYQMAITPQNRFLENDLIVVGDVHGQVHLLRELRSLVKDTGINLLFLGDLMDRAQNTGDDSLTLEIVRDMRENPKKFGINSCDSLMGNHEKMFLSTCENPQAGELWAQNGGDLESFYDLQFHQNWLKKLPLYKKVGQTLFVHAGIRPGINLKDQHTEDLVWIRDPFLAAQDFRCHGIKRVIHGHTPNFLGGVQVTHNRINLDSGAFFTGKLSVYNHRSGEIFQICHSK